MKPTPLLVAAALIAAGGFVLTRGGQTQGLLPAAAQAQQAESSPEATAEAAAIEIKDMVLGAEDAPLEIVEYASFTCPHCADFHEDIMPRIIADYVDTGKARFIYREVYFDRPGLWGSMLARCGGEEKFFGVTALLFEKQREWIGNGQLPDIAANLRTLGKTAGLTDEQLEVCLGDADQAQALVNWYEANATADKITATPSLVIGGETVSNQSYEKLQAIIDAKLEG